MTKSEALKLAADIAHTRKDGKASVWLLGPGRWDATEYRESDKKLFGFYCMVQVFENNLA